MQNCYKLPKPTLIETMHNGFHLWFFSLTNSTQMLDIVWWIQPARATSKLATRPARTHQTYWSLRELMEAGCGAIRKPSMFLQFDVSNTNNGFSLHDHYMIYDGDNDLTKWKRMTSILVKVNAYFGSIAEHETCLGQGETMLIKIRFGSGQVNLNRLVSIVQELMEWDCRGEKEQIEEKSWPLSSEELGNKPRIDDKEEGFETQYSSMLCESLKGDH